MDQVSVQTLRVLKKSGIVEGPPVSDDDDHVIEKAGMSRDTACGSIYLPRPLLHIDGYIKGGSRSGHACHCPLLRSDLHIRELVERPKPVNYRILGGGEHRRGIDVWLLGASLNSVQGAQHVNTVLVPVSKPGATALHEEANRMWDAADPVEPMPEEGAE